MIQCPAKLMTVWAGNSWMRLKTKHVCEKNKSVSQNENRHVVHESSLRRSLLPLVHLWSVKEHSFSIKQHN